MPEPLERFVNSDGEYVIIKETWRKDPYDGRLILAVALHGNTRDPFVVWSEGVSGDEPYRYSGGYHDNIDGALREYNSREASMKEGGR